MLDRPPADPAKLLAQLRQWRDGDTTPGRTVADLKTGGLPDVLAATEGRDDLAEPWERWERGALGPSEVLRSLDDAGIDEVLEALVEHRPSGA